MSLGREAAERLGALMQHVGFAVWQLQELENTAAGYIVVRLRGARGVGVERGTEISAEVERLPLGRLIGELAQAGVVGPDLASRLRTLLDERNWLVHRSRQEHRGVLSNDAMFASLLMRLEGIADRALALNKELASEMEGYVVSSGVSRDLIDREAERLARSWGLLE